MRFTAIHALALLLLLAGAAPRALAGTNCPPIKFARRDVPSACKSSSDATVCGAGGCVDQLSDLVKAQLPPGYACDPLNAKYFTDCVSSFAMPLLTSGANLNAIGSCNASLIEHRLRVKDCGTS